MSALVLSAAQSASVESSAIKFALAEGATDDAIKAVKAALGDAPSFELFELVRVAWRAAYCGETDRKVSAGDTAWSRFVSVAGIKKPKAQTTDAQRVAASRDPQAKVEKAKQEAEKAREAVAVAEKAGDADKVVIARAKAAIADSKVQAAQVIAQQAIEKAAKAEQAKAESQASKGKREATLKALTDNYKSSVVVAHALDYIAEGLTAGRSIVDLVDELAKSNAKAKAKNKPQAERKAA